MKVAVIGCGSAGARHARNLHALGCEVFVCDVDHARAATIAAELGLAGWDDDASDALLSAVEAVVVATPHDHHLAGVERAVANGLPFYVEKPLGTLAQLPQWRALAARDLPIHQVGYQLRFHARIQQIRAFVPAPTSGQFFLACDARTWPGQGYGPLLLECSHEIDLALWCGAPATIDEATVDAHEVSLWFGADRGEGWYVSLRNDSPRYHRQWGLKQRGAEATACFDDPTALGPQMYRDALAHFLACVRDQRPTICPLADGLRVLEVCVEAEARGACA